MAIDSYEPRSGGGMAKGPLRRKYAPVMDRLFGDFRRERLQLLCKRLGVAYTDNEEDQVAEMWAELGERLALTQPEFQRPTKRGRARKVEKAQYKIANLVDQSKRPGETDEIVIQRLISEGVLPQRARETFLSEVSRGRADVRRREFNDPYDDEWRIFEERW
jgi:hypothetical protein